MQRKNLLMLTAVVVLIGALHVGVASAIKYMPLGDAVKSLVPSGARIFKVTGKLSAAQRATLTTSHGWQPQEDTWEYYVGREGDVPQAYVFVVSEIFSTCFHKYAVGLTATGAVKEAIIVELTCPRSFPINKRSFLSQFDSKTHRDPLTVKADIDAITGATLSSEASSTAVRKAVSLYHVWIGGGAPIAVSAATKAARDKGSGMIQKAIETGETLQKQGKDGAAQLPPDER